MPLPDDIGTFTLTAAFPPLSPDGTERAGTLTFTPVPPVLVADTGIYLGIENSTLSASGTMSKTLVANDALDEPFVWRVDVDIDQLPPFSQNISVPASAGTVALGTVLETEALPGNYYVVVGPQGPQGESGSATGALLAANNLNDITSASAARTSLGLGTAATAASGAFDAAGLAAAAQSAAATDATTKANAAQSAATTAASADATTKVATHTAATDPHADRAYADTQIAALTALTQTKVKTADEPRTSVTTVSDDGHLFASLEANSVYRFRTMLLFDGPEAADASITFTVPSGATGGWSPVAGTLGTTVPDGSASVKMAARQFGSNSDVGVMASSATLAGLMALPHGFVVTSSTPGLLRLRWAQQTSNATAVNLKAGSTLEVVKVSGSGPAASGIRSDFYGNYPSDQGLLDWMYDPDEAGHVTAQSSSVAGQILLSRKVVRQSYSWSGIWYGLAGVDAAASLSNCYLGVYNAAGVRQGVTADLSAVLVTNPVGKRAALTAAFTTTPGEYFIALLLGAGSTWTTNGLTFKASGAGISVNAGLAAPRLRYSNMLTGQTSLPATLDLTQQTTTLINTGYGSQWYGID